MSNICVIGAGYVGLVTAVGFAELGHKVTLLEIVRAKLSLLERDELPIREPGLTELWQRHHSAGRIQITNNYIQGLLGAEFAFIAVGTPSTRSGKPNLKSLRAAAKGIAETASGPLIVVIKSTVPVGTSNYVSKELTRYGHSGFNFSVVSNPEFLREGAVVFDFFNPSRVVVGSSDAHAADAVAELYKPLNSDIIICDNGTAEMSKYASNVFLATRISFMNEVALLCDACNVDIVKMAKIMGMDPRFGTDYLNAGLGWGGSCLPKDVRGFIHMGKIRGIHLHMTRVVQQINQSQPLVVVKKLNRLLGNLDGKTIGILGLAFKPGSDDMREARSLTLISLLMDRGCQVKACDPVASEKAAAILPNVACGCDAYETARDCDALVLVTEWDEFKSLDLNLVSSIMKQPIIIDGRNALDPEKMREAGFVYEGIGRGSGQRDLKELPFVELTRGEKVLTGNNALLK